jgi:hypothetical protein
VVWRIADEAAVNRRLAEITAALDRDDPHWRWADLVTRRAAVPDAENGALVVGQIGFLLLGNGAAQSTSLFQELERLPPDARLAEDQYRQLANDLAGEVQDARALARTLPRYRTGRYPLPAGPLIADTPLSHVQDVWKVYGRVLWREAMVHAHEGDIAAAVRDCHGVLVLARTLGDEPFWVSQYVRRLNRDRAVQLLERALAHGEAPAADLAALQAALAEEGQFDVLPPALRLTRAQIHETFAAVEQGQMTLNSPLGMSNASLETVMKEYDAGGMFAPSLASRLRADHAAFLRLANQLLDITHRAPSEQAPAIHGLEADLKAAPFMTRTTVGGMIQRFHEERSAQARLWSAVAALAVERYRLARGRWPESLADVVPEFLAAVPADPYDGQPLRYRRRADGVVVYCVGPDGTSDGSKPADASPPAPGTDLGFRLWDVPHRRQPPPLEARR